MDISYLKEHGLQIDSFSYRGFEVGFYEDISGHQIVAIWDDKLYEFGVYNTTSYKNDMKLIIDDYLDTISRFVEQPAFYGAKLERFQNGGFSDVRLVYRGRVLGVWLEPSDFELKLIEKEAVERLLDELRSRCKAENSPELNR